ncbi:MAG: ribosomal-processing cysteine protease Prp [Lachnospiraceae bacterium]|nr:ribosomal-processing cysteine protease Prp [Lachnospiraceae bacterium]
MKITVKEEDGIYTSFKTEGHAGFAEEGYDIVCAGVSALVINFINSIDELCDDKFEFNKSDDFGESSSEADIIEFRFISIPSKDAQLLFKSLVIGLKDIQNSYGTEFVQVDII